MRKLKYLNVGCGLKFHTDWVNIDMASQSPHVIAANLLKGIPYPNNHFEVVYHSQVLEHIPKHKSLDFIKECYRVLNTDGIIRVVVPDLENIVNEYITHLNKNLKNPDELSTANYDWIMLEMYDQTVRNYSGGQMAEYLIQPAFINENYVIDRIGFVGRSIREGLLRQINEKTTSSNFIKAFSSITMFKRAIKYTLDKVIHKMDFRSKASKIGAFRLGGEVHMWMYDRYSLGKLLSEAGFVDISIKNPWESDILNWNKYQLDVKDGLVYDPTSLFMEARKGAVKK